MKLETNTIYRYASPYNEAEETIDGLPNYLYKTYKKLEFHKVKSSISTVSRGA